MTRLTNVLAIVILVFTLPAAAGKKKKAPQPDRVVVQHILVAFGDTLGRDRRLQRDEAQARYLAYQLLERAQKGEDFDGLEKEHSNDRHPGIYALVNKGIEPDPEKKEYPRKSMVPCFGELAFSLDVGEIDIANFNADLCPYGWHIVKRLE
jgi:parvulin-like peptidyl-prolyl isomerase